tara:strand:- start:871 stop:1029 length:159 start_codon:yes stop_codon:yes gene_type:complete
VVSLNVLVFLNVDARFQKSGLKVYGQWCAVFPVVFSESDKEFCCHLKTLSVL